MQNKPNFLGLALSYVTDAVEYAAQKSRTGRVLGLSNGFGRNNEHRLRPFEQGSIGNLGHTSIPDSPSSFDESLTIMSNRGHFNTVKPSESVDVQAALKIATLSAWVYSDLRLISTRVGSEAAWPQAKKVIKGKKRDEYEDLYDHPIEQLLLTPNNLMTGSYLMEYLTTWFLLLGNGYFFIATPEPGRGKPTELWPLPANQVVPLPNTIREGMGVFKGKPVVDFAYTVEANSPPIKLPGENVLHRRTMNPYDYWQGFSPLNAALLAIEQDRAQEKYVRDFFGRDNAVPTSIISLPKEMRPLDFNRAREQLYEQMAEGRKSLVTRAGDIDVEVIKQTINDMQITSAREFSRREIDTIFGVPDGLINGGQSGDSRLASEITFARNVIQPLIDGLARDLTNNICPYYGPDVVMIAPNIIPQDQALEVQKFTQYRSVRTINENRKELSLPPLAKLPEGLFDQLEGIDIYNDLPTMLVPNLIAMQQQEDAAEDAQEAASMSMTGVSGSGSYQSKDNAGTSQSDEQERISGRNPDQSAPKRPRNKRNSRAGNTDPKPEGMPASDKPAQASAREAVKQVDSLGEAVKQVDISSEEDEKWDEVELSAAGADLSRLRRILRKAVKEEIDPIGKIKSFESSVLNTDILIEAYNLNGIDSLTVENLFD